MSATILLLPGDGIGPEIIAEAKAMLEQLTSMGAVTLEIEEAMIGGAALDAGGDPLPEQTLARARNADGILFGAVGGPQWDGVENALRPERGLLRLRAELGVFSNLRPAITYPQLVQASSLKADKVSGLDLMIVRELTGGIYFGTPKGIRNNDQGQRQAFNTMVYAEPEIERVLRAAFEIADRRAKRLCSVDKANVLDVSVLWRDVAERVAQEFPAVELSHMYVDNAAMQLVREPKQFDVMVTGNLFGDILSDLASMLAGSIGMLPSASLAASGQGLYEPIHGSAPDIAGKDLANPLATLLSVAMLFRYSLRQDEVADRIERAVASVLDQGLRTADIDSPGCTRVGTREMGQAVREAL